MIRTLEAPRKEYIVNKELPPKNSNAQEDPTTEKSSYMISEGRLKWTYAGICK
jgi:hypothetical protein